MSRRDWAARWYLDGAEVWILRRDDDGAWVCAAPDDNDDGDVPGSPEWVEHADLERRPPEPDPYGLAKAAAGPEKGVRTPGSEPGPAADEMLALLGVCCDGTRSERLLAARKVLDEVERLRGELEARMPRCPCCKERLAVSLPYGICYSCDLQLEQEAHICPGPCRHVDSDGGLCVLQNWHEGEHRT